MPRPFRLTPLPIRENDVERACLDLLRYRGYYVVRLHSGLFKTPDGSRWVRVGEPGLPDYVALHERHPAFFLETKRPGSKPSPEQVKKQWELLEGYHIASITADDSATLARWLQQHETKH